LALPAFGLAFPALGAEAALVATGLGADFGGCTAEASW
jgi:hypothetical protein